VLQEISMSVGSDVSVFDSLGDHWKPEGKPGLAEQFLNVGHFLRGFRVKLRFGEVSRAPLRPLRFNILGEVVRCDWLARLADPWDADLAPNIREQHASLQTLRDAIDVRALLFHSLPEIDTADFRVFRESANHAREIVMTGCAQRNDHSARGVHSLAMRAKVLGFRFHLEGNVLRRISAGPDAYIAD
jgi:hypothetical protein